MVVNGWTEVSAWEIKKERRKEEASNIAEEASNIAEEARKAPKGVTK